LKFAEIFRERERERGVNVAAEASYGSMKV